jgi:hypothetical protein
MRINEDFLDNIDSNELTVSSDDIDNEEDVNQEDFPIHFIFAVTRFGSNREEAMRKIANLCRNKMSMFFEGRHALFYQDNQYSEMKRLLPSTQFTDNTGLKLCLDGRFISIRHLLRFLYICYKCRIDRMYFIRPDLEQIQFPFMSELHKFYEHPEQFRLLDNKNFFDAMIRLIIMLWTDDKQHQVDRFCSILQFDRYKKYLCTDMVPYTFLGHFENNIDIPIDEKLRQKIESVELDTKLLLDKKSYVNLIFSQMTDPMNQFLESELAKRNEIKFLQEPVHLSHIRLQYHPTTDWNKTPIIFLFGYIGIYRSYIRSRQLQPVYMDVCLAFKGKCDFLDEDVVNPDAEFIKRCKAIFGGAVAKEIANTFWFWFDNPALEND